MYGQQQLQNESVTGTERTVQDPGLKELLQEKEMQSRVSAWCTGCPSRRIVDSFNQQAWLRRCPCAQRIVRLGRALEAAEKRL